MRLTFRQIQAYFRQIPRLRAAQQLRAIEVASVPHMKAEDRKTLLRDLQRAARGEEEKPAVVIANNSDLKKFITGALRGGK